MINKSEKKKKKNCNSKFVVELKNSLFDFSRAKLEALRRKSSLGQKKMVRISLSLSLWLAFSLAFAFWILTWSHKFPPFCVSDMSFLKGLIDAFDSIFSSPAYDSNPNPNPIHPNSSSSSSSSSSSTMEGVSNERVAHKLKGYHDLATEEIAKAVRAEEWGLVDDAILHYKNAQRILLEASSTPAPSYITSR